MNLKKALGSALVATILLGTLSLSAEAAAMKKSTGAAGGSYNNTATALLLSSALPGLGESYLSGWKNGWSLSECVVGTVCFPFHLSSMIDAASGLSNEEMRFDFWTLPGQ